MKDLAKDDNLDPNDISEANLRKADVSPGSIEQIKRLDNLSEKLKDDEKQNVSEVRTDLENIIKKLESQAEDILIEKAILENPDELERKMFDAEKIKKLEISLPKQGILSEGQEYKIMKILTDIVRDIARDPEAKPENLNKQKLREA